MRTTSSSGRSRYNSHNLSTSISLEVTMFDKACARARAALIAKEKGSLQFGNIVTSLLTDAVLHCKP